MPPTHPPTHTHQKIDCDISVMVPSTISEFRCSGILWCNVLSMVARPLEIERYLATLLSCVRMTATPSVSNCGLPALPTICKISLVASNSRTIAKSLLRSGFPPITYAVHTWSPSLDSLFRRHIAQCPAPPPSVQGNSLLVHCTYNDMVCSTGGQHSNQGACIANTRHTGWKSSKPPSILQQQTSNCTSGDISWCS
jgi:hypothetical protein